MPCAHPFFPWCHLTGKASFNVQADYLNSKLRVLEPLVEPWRVAATVSKPHGEKDPGFLVHASEVHVNVTRALMALSEQIMVSRTATAASAQLAASTMDRQSVRMVNTTGERLMVALLPSRSSSKPAPPAASDWHNLPCTMSGLASTIQLYAPLPATSSPTRNAQGATAGVEGGGSEADDAAPHTVWVAVMLPGSRVVSLLRLRHDGAHALTVRRRASHSASAEPARSSVPSSASAELLAAGGVDNTRTTERRRHSSASSAGHGDEYVGLEGSSLALVCEVCTSEVDGTTMVRVRSAHRLHNKCKSAVDIVCRLPLEFAPRTSRMGREVTSARGGGSGGVNGVAGVGGAISSCDGGLSRSDSSESAMSDALGECPGPRWRRRSVSGSAPSRAAGRRSTESDLSDQSEGESSLDEGSLSGMLTEDYLTLERTVQPDESLELPLWAMHQRATLQLKRAVASRWDVPISLTTHGASADGSEGGGTGGGGGGVAAAAAPMPGQRLSGVGAVPRSSRTSNLHFFEVAFTTSPLLDPASSSSGARSLSDTTITLTWRAKLQNLLPVAIELLAGADDGAMAGGMGYDGPAGGCRLMRAILPPSEHAELPVDELPRWDELIVEHATNAARGPDSASLPSSAPASSAPSHTMIVGGYDATGLLSEESFYPDDTPWRFNEEQQPTPPAESSHEPPQARTRSDNHWRLRLRLRVCAPSPSVAWRWTKLLELRPHPPSAHLQRGGKAARRASTRDSHDALWTLHTTPHAHGDDDGGEDDERDGQRMLTLALGSSCSAQLGIDPKMGGDGRTPTLLLWSPYWLINKTGLRLAYHLQRAHVQLGEPSFDTATGSYATASDDHHGGDGGGPSSDASVLDPPPTPLMIACEAGEQLVVQVRPYGHQPNVGGRAAAIRAPAIRGLLAGRIGMDRLAVGCSAAFSMDALGSAGEIPFEGGGVLGCAIEPAPGGFSITSSTVSISPRYAIPCINHNRDSLDACTWLTTHRCVTGTWLSTSFL